MEKKVLKMLSKYKMTTETPQLAKARTLQILPLRDAARDK